MQCAANRGGNVEIHSKTGEGSTAKEIWIPLTLAVMTVLVVQTPVHQIAIPIDRIDRTIRLQDQNRVTLADGSTLIHLDEGVVSEIDG